MTTTDGRGGQSRSVLLQSRIIDSIKVYIYATYDNYDEKVIKNRQLVLRMSVPVIRKSLEIPKNHLFNDFLSPPEH